MSATDILYTIDDAWFDFFFQIFKHKEKIQDISTTASNEATLELMLQKVQRVFSVFLFFSVMDN